MSCTNDCAPRRNNSAESVEALPPLASSVPEWAAAYGLDVLNLVLARGYLVKLVGNSAVEQYLRRRHPEVLTEFESIIRTLSLEQ